MHTQDNICLGLLSPFIKKQSHFFSPFSDPSSYTIFDVGTNVGDFTKLVKVVYTNSVVHCFEPNDIVYRQLKKNLSGYTNVVLNNLALGREAEKKMFTYPDRAAALGGFTDRPIFHTWTDSNIVQIVVNVITVDDYVKTRGINEIDILKIDVEGHESSVLLGSKMSLKNKIVKTGTFEYGETWKEAGFSLREAVTFLNTCGYVVLEGDENNVGRMSELIPETLSENYRWENLVFVDSKLLERIK